MSVPLGNENTINTYDETPIDATVNVYDNEPFVSLEMSETKNPELKVYETGDTTVNSTNPYTDDETNPHLTSYGAYHSKGC